MRSLHLPILRAAAGFLLAATALPATAAANEQIVLRSGQINGAPGAHGQLDDQITCIYTSTCNVPLANHRFDPTDFAAAAAGTPAVICNPIGPWPPALANDPLAQWINWGGNPSHPTTGAGSALYAISFQVATPGATTCTVDLSWRIDDQLGDVPGDPNPSGAFLNGVSLDAGFGPFNIQYAQPGVPIHTGTNTFYVYQRDSGCSDAGIMFSCTIDVDPPCANELIVLRSGQNGGAPGTGGQLDDIVNDIFTSTCNAPLSNQAFTPADFAAAASGQAAVICFPLSVWPQNLPDDPDARWINWGDVGGHLTTDPGSALYAIPFQIDTATATTASVELSWHVDDQIGDLGPPNQAGVYVNELPLDDVFTGGGTRHVQSAVPVQPGANTLYIYQRDSGCSDAGIMFSCTIRVPQECESMTKFCFPETDGVRPCPCGNPPVPNDGTRGCNNYGPTPAGGTGGAILTATGDPVASNATDLAFHVNGMQTPCSLVVFFGGTTQLTTGVTSGGGVRCVASLITPRMYKTVTTFNAGSVDFPSASANPNTDPWTRSNAPAPGNTLYYYAAYRNGQLGGHPPCTPQTAFNLTNAGAVTWHL